MEKFGAMSYTEEMEKLIEKTEKLREAANLQALEGNPLDAEDKAMFEMFEREGWSLEQQRAYIIEKAKTDALVPAAE